MLTSLLQRHPGLTAEAEELARRLVNGSRAEAVADSVEHVLLDLDADEMYSRAGAHHWGYVEPTEAAWEVLGEAVEPFFQDLRRLVELGMETAAIETCSGIVLGLYRCRGHDRGELFEWAEDFPDQTAAEAVATLSHASATRYRHAWRLPETFGDQVPEWAELVTRASRRRSQRHK